MTKRFIAIVTSAIILFSLITFSVHAQSENTGWVEKTPYAYEGTVTPIGASAAAVVNGKIYVFGNANWTGYPNGKDWVNIYDPETNTWVKGHSMPQSMYVRVAVVDNIIYVFGAYRVDPNIPDSLISSVYKYDPATDSWSELAANPAARMISSVAVVNGIIYVMGGQSQYLAFSNSVEAYNPSTNSWTTNLAPMPSARSWIEAVSANGKIYAVGGWNGSGMTNVDVYDPQENSWASVSDLPLPMWDTGYNIVEKDNKIYIIGGCTGVTCNMFSQVYVYDIENDNWSPTDGNTGEIPDYPIQRSGGMTVLVGDTIYSIGGYVYGTFFSENYAYDLSNPLVTPSTIQPSLTFTPESSSTYTPIPTYTPISTYTEIPTQTDTPTPMVSPTQAFVFSGFFPPVDNIPIINVVKAGSAIPVKFSLGGNFGLNILSQGYPASSSITCGSNIEDTIEQTVTASTSSLQYDSNSQQYTYIWKTDKSWSGTCRNVILKFIDGTIHKANFKFK